MKKPKEYKTAGTIGLCCYLFFLLLSVGRNSIASKWLWQGEDLLHWFFVFLVIVAHVIILAAFINLFSHSNWNKKFIHKVIDGLFFSITLLYILFWLFAWAMMSAFDFSRSSFS
jgi:hypothetical protein